MLEKIRTITKQKGQGIVEYALLLAFVVGIGMMLNGANLGGAVKDTFDKVATFLADGSTSNEPVFDLTTTEGKQKKDVYTMKKIGAALKKLFGEGGRFALSTNEFAHVTFFSNGDVGLYVSTGDPNKWFAAEIESNNPQNVTVDPNSEYLVALKNEGIDLSKLKIEDTQSSAWKNGVTVYFNPTKTAEYNYDANNPNNNRTAQLFYQTRLGFDKDPAIMTKDGEGSDYGTKNFDKSRYINVNDPKYSID